MNLTTGQTNEISRATNKNQRSNKAVDARMIELLAAMEFGYKACENGKNLQMAQEQFRQIQARADSAC